MKNITNSLLLLVLWVLLAHAAQPTPWDSMPQDSIGGSITVTLNDGQKHRAKTARFTPSSVILVERGEKLNRDDVREVVIRAHRDFCCWALFLPVLPLAIAVSPDPGDTIAATVGVAIFMVPVEAVFIAVTPPIAAVQAIKRLKPAKIFYRVVP